jgi:hypothetical protein
MLNAFNVTAAGADSPLLNQIFNGLNIPGVGVVNGTTSTGSQAMRQNATLQAYLINNNVGGFANFLGSNTFVTGIRGGLLLNGHLPANFVVVNPQLGTAALLGNFGNSTYNSLQVEVNKRFQSGFSVQASYVRSKTLGSYDGNTQNEVSSFLTLRNEHLSKQLLSFDLPNVWRTSGVWDLPFGPGRRFVGSSHGLVSHLVEKWQTAVIFNKQSRTPTSFSNSAGNTFNNAGATDIEWGPLPSGGVHKAGNNIVYFTGLTQVTDPSVANIPLESAKPEHAESDSRTKRPDPDFESCSGPAGFDEPVLLPRPRRIYVQHAGVQGRDHQRGAQHHAETTRRCHPPAEPPDLGRAESEHR